MSWSQSFACYILFTKLKYYFKQDVDPNFSENQDPFLSKLGKTR